MLAIFYVRVRSQVSLQSAGVRKSHVANGARVRFLTGVSAHVRAQIAGLSEGLAADAAIPQLVTYVQCVLVPSQLRGARELARTLRARVRLFAGVNPTVDLERFRLPERLGTLRADVRPNAGVDSHVQLQQGGVLETSPALRTYVGRGI
jgi:hypothetical protein